MMPYELEELQAKENITPQKKIANNFIQNVITNNTETALKIVWYLASRINKCNLKKDINTFTINESDLKQATGTTTETIRRNLKAMMKTTITFIDEEKRVDKYRQLIPSLDIKYDGTIEIEIYTIVAKMIIEVVHENTTFIDIPQLLKLKNKHSIRLLPLLKTISEYDEDRGIKKQKTEGLRFWNSLFGTKYKRLKLIEVEIIKKVKEELDNNSTLTFNYKMNKRPVGKGRPGIQDITIIPIPNNNYQSTIFTNFTEEPTEQEPTKEKEEIKEPIKEKPKLSLKEEVKIGEKIKGEIDLEMFFAVNKIEEKDQKDYYYRKEIDFIDYCIENSKDYKDYLASFLRYIEIANQNNWNF